MKRVSILVIFLSIAYVVPVNALTPSTTIQPTKYYEENNIKNGDSDTYFLQKYGIPAYEHIKPRHKFIGEYNVGLNQTYPITDPKLKDVPIKEVLWHLEDDLNLTCWFHYKDGQWSVISYFFWPPGAMF